MIFPDYSSWQSWLYPLAGAASALVLWHISKSQNKVRRYVAGALCVFAALATCFLMLLFSFFGFFWEQTIRSAPLFSPDHSQAIVVFDNSAGALGGSTYVQLYFAHGLLSNLIFVGDYSQSDVAQIKWQDNEHIILGYHRQAGAVLPRCNQGRWTAVQCKPIDP